MPTTTLTRKAKRTDWRRTCGTLVDAVATLTGLLDGVLDATAGGQTLGWRQHRSATVAKREALKRVAQALGVSDKALEREDSNAQAG